MFKPFVLCSGQRIETFSPRLPLFQNLVNKMWIGVASQDKMEIRSCLPKLLLAQQKSVPYFIRNKLCKVIVDIGRQDWPMFYHDFFTNTLQVGPILVSDSLKVEYIESK